MNLFRKNRKRASVTGTAEEARVLEALVLQAYRTGSDEAWKELTGRTMRCLERGRVRPLQQVLGSLAEQRRWRAFGELIEWIQRRMSEEVVDRLDEQGRRIPALALPAYIGKIA